jgi:hypothetical protein
MVRLYGTSYKGEKDCVMLMDDFLPRGKYSNTGNAGPFLAYNRPSGYGGVGGWFKKDIEVWACLLEAAYVFNTRVNMV